MNVDISFIKEGDEDAINDVAELTKIFINESLIYKHLQFNVERFKAFSRLFTKEGAWAILARIDGHVAGYMGLVCDDTYIDNPKLEMGTMYVHPDYRNSGVGNALVSTMVRVFDSGRFGYCQASVCAFFEEDRELIQRATELLFRRKGFEQIGTIWGKKEKSNG